VPDADPEYQVVVQESSGLDRTNIPIQFGVRIPASHLDRDWQLTDGQDHLPVQLSIVDADSGGQGARVSAYCVLPTVIGNERKQMTLRSSDAPPSTIDAPLDIQLSDAGLSHIQAGDQNFLTESSAYPIVGISDASIQGAASARQNQSRETTTPTGFEISRLQHGSLVDRWEVIGRVGPDDAFQYTTTLTVHKSIPRVDVQTRLRNTGCPAYLSHFGHAFHLNKPDRLEILARDDAFEHLVDVNLAAATLQSGWTQSGIRLVYATGEDLILTTKDLSRRNDGMITATNVGRSQDRTDVVLHRIEPVWHYRGITSHAPTQHLHFHEGQTRSASFTLIVGDRDTSEEALIAVEDGVEAWVETDRSIPAASPPPSLLNRLEERALGFVIPSGEYRGLLAGGRCHINHRLIEYGVNRVDYAEYLLRHFLRTGSTRILSTVISFADAFIDISIHRSDRDAESWGAVRQRYRENLPDRVRSMRGPRLLLTLADLTGDVRYRDTALEIGEYILKHFPDRFARQGGACRELATLFLETGDSRYKSKAHDILNEVSASQLPEGPWYEYYETDYSSSILDVHQAGLYTIEATEKPEMSSYNIVGILDSQPNIDISPWMPMVEKACDWMVAVQDDEGAWRFPRYDSNPQWGHGIFQDVLAMLLAYQAFGKPSYLDAADRGIAWAERVWDENGYIPSVTRQLPHSRLEASLTYFYGLEAIHLRAEV